MVKLGVRCCDIDVATQEFFKSKGNGGNIIHRTGHGIGLGNHEQPWVSSGTKDELAENMMICIEPALYFPEIGGFRHSDTVLVTKDGFERITYWVERAGRNRSPASKRGECTFAPFIKKAT